ncbi:MAG: isochorismatase family protein [Thermoguttaceae bacterium]
MSAGDTGLLVIDVQVKLLPAVADSGRIVWNARRLIDGARILGLPVAATEQYPQGLGPTVVTALLEGIDQAHAKLAFSCYGCPQVIEGLRARGVGKLLLCGIETHVSVQQSVLDLLADGWRVYVAVDAVGARHAIDHLTALDRMDSAGATLTTTEAALFEWCQAAGTPQFREISRLVREEPPAGP